ncbi:MAG: Uma2 family endonuclease [Saprospiraceae bacterium]|nr:Uma2 family endonuclease [Saprospiraceae bacterium]
MVALLEKKAVKKSERLYSLREYLEKEEKSVYKHEFHNGKIIRMPGGKFNHNAISSNLVAALKYLVKPLPQKFWVINSDQKIYIEAADKVLYPDALVICEQPEFWEDREDLIVNPLVIVEVLSKSTAKYDRGAKFFIYETIPSFKEYVLVEQDSPLVETWFRETPTTWIKSQETNLNNAILLRSLGVSVNLVDIYENISFTQK